MENNAMKKNCSFCGEELKSFQKRCQYCGSLLHNSREPNSNTSVKMEEIMPSNTNENMDDEYIFPFKNYNDEGKSDRELLGLDDIQDSGDNDSENPAILGIIDDEKLTMSNGFKVLLTTLFIILPGIGQIAGLITSIVFMNSHNSDRISYGKALFVACIIVFFTTIAFYFLMGITFLYVLSGYIGE